MKTILSLVLFAVLAFTSSAQLPLQYNLQTVNMKDSVNYTTISATTYTGPQALSFADGYLFVYSDTTISKAGTTTSVTLPRTLLLNYSNQLVSLYTVPGATGVSWPETVKMDSTYIFYYQGQTDSVRFHVNQKFNIRSRGIGVNVADNVSDIYFREYDHVYMIQNPQIFPQYR